MLTAASTEGLIRPGHPDWESIRGTFNLLEDQRPEAIARPTDAHEVAAAVRYARDHGLRVVAQTTGHHAGPLQESLEGALIINTSALTGVAIDAAARSVRVGAATKWEKVTPHLSDLGLAALHGSSPDVGIAGYSVSGGIGWLGRKYGMQCNAVTAFEIVTADGELIRTDADHDPDLFWAQRGGDGNFGVVTAVEFSVQPLRQLYTGALFFPVERISEVLHAWTALLPSFPEELTTWASAMHFPPLPDVPDALRGKSFIVVMVAFLGSEAEGRALLSPLRRLGPVTDTLAVQPPIALAELSMDPTQPLPYRVTSALLDALPSATIEALSRIGGPGSALTTIELRHIGGALSRPAPGAGARATLPGNISLLSFGVIAEPAAQPKVMASLAELSATVAPHRVGLYPNFVEEAIDASTLFDAPTWQRLRRVKAHYDPQDLFRGSHHIPPASAR